MPPTLRRNGESLELDLSTCRGAEFGDALDKIRAIPGRRYDPDHKRWTVPAEPDVADRVMRSLRPHAADELIQWVRESRIQAEIELTTQLPEDADLLVPWARDRVDYQPEYIEIAGEREPFKGLMQHQRPVVDLVARLRKLLIADDMGLGKTGAALSGIEEWRAREFKDEGLVHTGPRLVIAPKSVRGTWVREIKLWLGPDTPHQVIDASGVKTRHNQFVRALEDDPNMWVIVNWDQIRAKKVKEKKPLRNGGTKTVTRLVMKEPLFETTPWLAVVADEIHRAKNRKSQQTQGLWRIRSEGGIMLGLSGTPLMNSPDELWAILRWLWPEDYHERGAAHAKSARSYWTFYQEYVEDYEDFYGRRQITGVKNPDALRFELTNRLVRRTQEILNLPGKRRLAVSLELNPKQRKLYDEAEAAMWLKVAQDVAEGTLDAKTAKEIIDQPQRLIKIVGGAARTVRLRQIIETPANLGAEDDSAILDDVVDRVMDSRPSQWIVFCEFKITVACLVERLRKQGVVAEAYTGDVTSHVEKSRLEDRFQSGEIDVMVGTIKAMKEGITLTAGNKQYWVSRDWVPDNNEQGEDRQNRIGQTTKVTVFIAQAEDTVAVDKVEPTNRLKEQIVRAILPKANIEEDTAP